jgi:hypothetical protein
MKQLSYFKDKESLSVKPDDFNFKFYKKYDVSDILNSVKKINDEWNIYDFRQNRKYSERRNPHLYTNTFVIQYHSFDWNFGDKIISEVKDPAMLDVVSKIVNDLELMCNGVSGRVLLIRLLANRDVSEHTDKGEYLSAVRRFHIPIITNELVSYTVNGETINMKEGECWEINNQKPHSVLNDSDIDRVHLLIDIFPEINKGSIDTIGTDTV